MRFTSGHQLWIRNTAAIAVGILLLPGMWLFAAPAPRPRHASKRHQHKQREEKIWQQQQFSMANYYATHDRYLTRYIAPARIRQIQKALIKAGFLHEKPNGRWDNATDNAMRQYQTQNGFAPTGLPEAKPLMKLGLGPHPLPPALARAAAKKANAQNGDKSNEASDSSTSKKSSSTSNQ